MFKIQDVALRGLSLCKLNTVRWRLQMIAAGAGQFFLNDAKLFCKIAFLDSMLVDQNLI